MWRDSDLGRWCAQYYISNRFTKYDDISPESILSKASEQNRTWSTLSIRRGSCLLLGFVDVYKGYEDDDQDSSAIVVRRGLYN